MKAKSEIKLLLLLPLLVAAKCGEKSTTDYDEMARRTSTPQVVLVETFEVQPAIFYHELVSNGRLYAHKKVDVPVGTQGIYTEVNAINGQRTEAGDMIGRVDDFQYQNNLTRAQQRLEKAKIDFLHELIGRRYDEEEGRAWLEGDTTIIRRQDLEFSLARSGLPDAELALKEAESNLNSTRIVAPISGRIANLEARVHNRTSNLFCTIVDDSFMEVEFPIIESEYDLLSINMPVLITPYADDTTSFTGRITEISPMTGNSGMINIKARFTNNGTLIEGMNARVLIRKPEPDRLVVPKESLVMRQGRDVIFIRRDSLAIWRYVTVEFENSSHLSIKPSGGTSEGIDAGDLVIVRGNVNLAHETVVKEDAR